MSYSFRKLNNLFKLFDQDDSLLSYRIGGWVAWSVVKETLWLTLRNSDTQSVNCANRVTKLSLLYSFIKSFKVIRDTFSVKKTDFILAFSPAFKRIDGRDFHPNFGFECTEGLLLGALKLIYQRAGDIEYKSHQDGNLHIKKLSMLLKPAIKLLYLLPSLRKIAHSIVNRMVEIESAIDRFLLFNACLHQLALFVVKEKIYRCIFSKTQAKYLLIQDPNGKMAEVAAAKSLGMSVIEIQHGIFSRNDIDYSWQEKHLKYKEIMLTADKILVYGEIWKHALCSNNYWSEKEIIIIGYPLMDYYTNWHNKNNDKLNLSDTINIFFISQSYIHKNAVIFWECFLTECIKQNVKVQLYIKLHPSEYFLPNIYNKLIQKFSNICKILSGSFDAYSNASKFHIIAGFSSMMLIDFVGLGKSVYSIACQKSIEDVCSMFGLTELQGVIKPILNIEELITEVKEYKFRIHEDISRLNDSIFFKSKDSFNFRLRTAVFE